VALAGIVDLGAWLAAAACTYSLLPLAVNISLLVSVFEVLNYLMPCILSFIADFWMQEKVRYMPYLMAFVCTGCLPTAWHV
jgi:hypothetical protein